MTILTLPNELLWSVLFIKIEPEPPCTHLNNLILNELNTCLK